MSVNRHLPHVFVLPEDDANRQLANGFRLEPSVDNRRMQILGAAGGWQEVLKCFSEDHIPEMDRTTLRFMVLLIDFDRKTDRLNLAKAAIPDRMKERVFVLGALSEPEDLRKVFGSYETIGRAMGKDCRDNTELTWAHDLLCHNGVELERLRRSVRPVLFSQS